MYKKIIAFLFRAVTIACAVGFIGSFETISRGGEIDVLLYNAVIYAAAACFFAILAEVLDGGE